MILPSRRAALFLLVWAFAFAALFGGATFACRQEGRARRPVAATDNSVSLASRPLAPRQAILMHRLKFELTSFKPAPPPPFFPTLLHTARRLVGLERSPPSNLFRPPPPPPSSTPPAVLTMFYARFAPGLSAPQVLQELANTERRQIYTCEELPKFAITAPTNSISKRRYSALLREALMTNGLALAKISPNRLLLVRTNCPEDYVPVIGALRKRE